MFSTIPSTGTRTWWNIIIAFRASSSETSKGVVTTIAPVTGALDQGELDVADRRQVDDEANQFAPVDAAELLDHRVQHGTAPYQGNLSPGLRKPIDMSLTPYCCRGCMRSPKAISVWLIPS